MNTPNTSARGMRKAAARPLIKKALKTAAAHLAAAVLCAVVTNVYALFGHGIRSASMDLMFLYPLLGGTAVFASLAAALPRLPGRPRPISRAGYNLYNSGVAALTAAAMLTGIMDIAGTASKWIAYIRAAGYILAAAAFVCQWMNRR
ncbi:MAG: hypothetical protein LBL26_13435 [Peptococcaceae bacterium]|jgi:hypothetical protein|nr:hypothetical protein [Peptococcaceae bacterium]